MSTIETKALAALLGVTFREVGPRLGVSSDYARRLADHPRHRHRIRAAVLELAAERERLREVFA